MLSGTIQNTVPLPIGNTIVAIDNNQILQKKWAIRVETQTTTSTITMVVAFIDPNVSADIECNPDVIPGRWRARALSEDDINHLKYIDKNEDVKRTHYNEHLFPYLSERLATVVNEQKLVNGLFEDEIDNKITRLQMTK